MFGIIQTFAAVLDSYTSHMPGSGKLRPPRRRKLCSSSSTRAIFLTFALVLFFFQQAALVRFRNNNLLSVENTPSADVKKQSAPLADITNPKKIRPIIAKKKSSQYIPSNNEKVITIYDSPPDLTMFPRWIVRYLSWHQDMRKKYPGMKLFTDPNAPKLLIRTCLGLCGGLHDRLGQLPFDLFLANQTQRLLLLEWQRPRELSNFLVPNVLDWSIMEEAHFGFDDIRSVRNYTQMFQDYTEDRPDDEFWDVHFDAAIKRATLGEYKDIRILRHRILGHVRESELEKRLLQLGEDPKVHDSPLFGMIFWLFFRPSPEIDAQFRRILLALNLIPNQYAAVHCRVRHPKATSYGIHVKGKNPKYPADKTGLPWEGSTRQFAIDVATRAISCAQNITNDPIYFLSDSNDLVRHVAFELSSEEYLRVNQSEVDPSLFNIIDKGSPIVSRDVSIENAHIDRQKGRPAEAYYGTFLDLLIAIHAKCVIYGIGYYARFSAKVSGTPCQMLYQEEEWGNQAQKLAQVCPAEIGKQLDE